MRVSRDSLRTMHLLDFPFQSYREEGLGIGLQTGKFAELRETGSRFAVCRQTKRSSKGVCSFAAN